jgi:hypothetical protein
VSQLPAQAPEVPRSVPADPRYEIVFERRGTGSAAVSKLAGGVVSIAQRMGAALGDAYALAARSVLHALERLEDSNAEQRVRRRSKRPPGDAPLRPAESPPNTSLSPPT